jgi:2,3-bisphosphoglycerate-independent phosphoglycerate mutase
METAAMPNLHALASRAACGLIRHVGPGITPGSGPGHLGLFGYDPIQYQVGRGVLEALGIEFDLRPGDVAARGNFCSVDAEGRITDRRAGRIATEASARLVERLKTIGLPGVEVFVEPVKEHRFVLVLRGGQLSGKLSETDPQVLGKAPLPVQATEPAAAATADLVNRFVAEARRLLRDAAPANMILLRGFDQLPHLPQFPEVFGLRAAAIAAYPMYRGLARLVGMEVLKTGTTFADEIDTLRQHWSAYDFFFLHYKDTDKAGEDGDFAAKVAALERFDAAFPAVLEQKPDVVVVTGDHASPSILAGHGWQPVPVLIASKYCGADPVSQFTERACAAGTLGLIPSHTLMPLVLANALRLTKFGA